MIKGPTAKYKFLVDGDTVVDGGPLVVVGIMPSARKTVDMVRQKLSA